MFDSPDGVRYLLPEVSDPQKAPPFVRAWTARKPGQLIGKGHPAVDFLLLLAVADDAVGLVIIAVFYGDSMQPAAPAFLGLVLAGMLLAFGFRRLGVNSWLPYVFIAGPLSWLRSTVSSGRTIS